MKVIQVYLPSYITETIQYNGLTTPLLRYYERMIAAHVAPILVRDLSRSGWERFIEKLKKGTHQGIKEIGYTRAIALGVILALYVLAKKWPKAGEIIDQIRSVMKKAGRPIEQLLENTEVMVEQRGNESLYTEVIFDKMNLKVQFIALPLTINDIRQIFRKDLNNNPRLTAEARKKAFVSLTNLNLTSELDIKVYVFDTPVVICSIEEIEDVKDKFKNLKQDLSIIAVDTVNEVVYTKIVINNKVFRYSVPLNDVVKKQIPVISLDRLASVLQGVKYGSTL